MEISQRWALLEHIDAPDDPSGRHFDLLLEDGECCRTWRLAQIPQINGLPIPAVPLPMHRLDWLNKKHCAVSQGRGWVHQVFEGVFKGTLPYDQTDSFEVYLVARELEAKLSIHKGLCQLRSINK